MDKAAVGLCKVYAGEAYLDKASVDSHEQLASTSSDAVEDQSRDVANSSACVHKNYGGVVRSSDYFDDANHKMTKSSALSVGSSCAEGSEICVSGYSAGNGHVDGHNSVEGKAGKEVLETAGLSDIVDPSVISVFKDELSGGTLSKAGPSDCSSDQAESSSVKMADLHITDERCNEESCASVKPEMESNDNSFNSSLPTTNKKEPCLQNHTLPQNESDELVDVRVCDICGDVGREALLALCSKCNDGAEHIYCMRIKMDKVPEDDWVCEDCLLMREPKKLKETEVERSDSSYNSSYLKDTTQELQVTYSGVGHVGESKANCLSVKRPASDMEVRSEPKRRALDKGNGSGRKTLSIQVPPWTIVEKSKGSQASPLRNMSATEVMDSTYLASSHSSPKSKYDMEARQSGKRISPGKSSQPSKPLGADGKSLLTRVSSLKIMNRGKVGCFHGPSTDIESAKKQVEQESSPSGHRSPKPKPQFQQPKPSTVSRGRMQLTRVSSLKMMNKSNGAHIQESSLGIESTKNKAQLESSPSVYRSSKPEPQFQPLKSSSASGRKSQLTRVSSLKIMDKGNDTLPVSSFGTCYAKKEMEQASPLRGHRSPKPESRCHADKLSLLASVSNLEVQQVHGDIFSEGQNAQGSADQELRKRHGKKLRKSMSFGGVSSVSGVVSNSHLSHASNAESLKYGSEGKSIENKSSQFGLPVAGFDAMKGLPSASTVVSEFVSRTHTPVDDVKNLEGSEFSGNLDLKVLASLACEVQSCENKLAGKTAGKAELGCLSRADDLHAMGLTLPASFPTDMASSGILAIPESEYIWKGTFQLEEGGSLPKYCGKIQAHLSTCASSKVLELVPKFQPEVILKEVPRLNTWPVQFQRSCPTEQDIALYFFAEDLLSHARSYSMLLEGMMRGDLALAANFNGFQLLVFSSSLLPVRSQRWNGLLFLWGVFRVKKVGNSSLPIPTLNAATLSQSVCTSFTDREVHKEQESANPAVLQSSSSTKSMDQSFGYDVSSAEKCVGSQAAEPLVSHKDDSNTLSDDQIGKEGFLDNDTGIHSDEKKEEDPDKYSSPHTHILTFSTSQRDTIFSDSKPLQDDKILDVTTISSFSVDSGPSGSSDVAGCAKSEEGQVEQFQDLSHLKPLNLDLCLRPMSEPDAAQVDLDLVLGFPDTNNKCKAKQFSKKRSSSEHGSVSLFLSLGTPCSDG